MLSGFFYNRFMSINPKSFPQPGKPTFVVLGKSVTIVLPPLPPANNLDFFNKIGGLRPTFVLGNLHERELEAHFSKKKIKKKNERSSFIICCSFFGATFSPRASKNQLKNKTN
jgi:hypothetical protein